MKLLFIITVAIMLSSCRGCVTSYAEQKASVLKICPTCTFVKNTNDGYYYATDTSKQPNILYKVVFKTGGFWYKASDIDHIERIN